MLLKVYPEKFINYLEKCSDSDKRIKKIKKIILKELVIRNEHVAKMDRLITICKNR